VSHLGEAIAVVCIALLVGMAAGTELVLWQARRVVAEDCAAVVAVRP
jgi:hypothetical protein